MEDSQGSRPAVEKRVVPDEPSPRSGDARIRTFETSRREWTGRDPAPPVPSGFFGIRSSGTCLGRCA